MDRAALKQVHNEICDIVNAHEGLWREVVEVARTKEHTREENPFKRLLAELDVIEGTIGVTEKTKDIRARMTIH